MKKDLTFNVDDYLKRLETIHEINFQDILWGKGLGERLKKEINYMINSGYNLNQYNLYHLNANYFVQYYDFFNNTRPKELPFQIYFYLITYKYTVQIWAEKTNEVFLNFSYHINKVNDNDIEEIKTIFLEFMENIDFKDKYCEDFF